LFETTVEGGFFIYRLGKKLSASPTGQMIRRKLDSNLN